MRTARELNFWISLFVFLFLFSVIASVVKGDTLTFSVDRNRYMRRGIAVEVARAAANAQPIKINYRIRTSPRNSCYTQPETLQVKCYSQVRKGILGRVLFLAEPLIIDGIIYTAGRANRCISWGTGVCNITERNQAGADRISWGVVACTHELGHLLGAWHDPDLYAGCPSIMHPAPLPFVGQCPLAFSDRSKNQILACNFKR